MSYKKFSKDDIFISRVKTYPKYSFFVHSGSVYINNMPLIPDTKTPPAPTFLNIDEGHISLHELNIGEARPNHSFIKAQLEHDSYKNVFKKDVINLLGKTPTGSIFNPSIGDTLTRRYPLSGSIYRTYLVPQTLPSNYISGSDLTISSNPNGVILHPSASALKNLAHHYTIINPALKDFDDYLTQEINMIKIPSVFYGSSLRKGSIDLKFFYTGSIISRCRDIRHNGQLIADSPPEISGSLVGHVFYNEGIMIFPKVIGPPSAVMLANHPLNNENITISYNGGTDNPKWIYFGTGLYSDDHVYHSNSPSASFEINFEGTSYLNNMTMLCHMDRGEYNYSNNPTYQDLSQEKIQYFNSSSFSYGEPPIKIKNVASSSHFKGEDDFRKVTYVTKIGIYDENDQLIMTADLARPYKKEEKDNFTFKVKYDLL